MSKMQFKECEINLDYICNLFIGKLTYMNIKCGVEINIENEIKINNR